jgi:hypothetical protein
MKRFVFVFLLACGGSKPAPAPAPTSPDETSSSTACTRDDECFCRVFNGAKFQPGREPSKCCADGCTDAIGKHVESNHCMTCVYD